MFSVNQEKVCLPAVIVAVGGEAEEGSPMQDHTQRELHPALRRNSMPKLLYTRNLSKIRLYEMQRHFLKSLYFLFSLYLPTWKRLAIIHPFTVSLLRAYCMHPMLCRSAF